MSSFQAIAAMSRNRVIGAGGKIPWHLPEDLQWFKRMTTGHVLVMGRKTFESIGKLLPQRETVVLSRSALAHPGARTARGLDELPALVGDRRVFICGGAQVYAQALPLCADLYLTLVKRTVDGDAFFPPFEDRFELVAELQDGAAFKILHYRNRHVGVWPGPGPGALTDQALPARAARHTGGPTPTAQEPENLTDRVVRKLPVLRDNIPVHAKILVDLLRRGRRLALRRPPPCLVPLSLRPDGHPG